MAASTVQDQATALLRQRVVEAKIRGASAPDIEAAAVLTSIAASLILNPRAVLYVASLARNGLLAALTTEIAQVDKVTQDVTDLNNISYEITDSSDLQKARVALLSIEGQQKISASNGSFEIYSNAINSFLNNQLAKNVKAPGATALLRPSQEAQIDLAADFGLLKTQHADTLDRLYALAVGIQNFLSSSITTAIGLTTATRSRQDLDDIIASLASNSSAASSRDFAVRLLTSKAAIGLLGAAPDYTKPPISTAALLPPGYNITGFSNPSAALARTVAGPYTVGSVDHLVATVNGVTVDQTTATLFPAQNQPAVLSSAVSYPVTIAASQNLFINFVADSSQSFTVQPDGTYNATTIALGTKWNLNPDGTFSKVYRVPLTAGSRTLAQILTDINAVITGIGLAVQLGATNRILIYGFSNSPNVFFQRISIALTAPNTIAPFYFTNSDHAVLGFGSHQFGVVGTTQALVLASLQAFYASLFSFLPNTDGTISLTTLATAIGTSALFSGGVSTTLGLAAAYLAVDDHVTFKGLVLGVATNPINPIGLLDVGDVFIGPTGQSTVSSISATGIVLAADLPTFDGSVTVDSTLLNIWTLLSSKIQADVQAIFKTKYAVNLNVLDQAIAPLAGEVTPSLVNSALTILTNLRSTLSGFITNLSDPTVTIPVGAASNEAVIVNSIVSTFIERKYDRALDFFLRCKIVDVFQMDWQTLSYGGALLKAAASLARTDVQFINTVTDGGTQASASQDRTGLPG